MDQSYKNEKGIALLIVISMIALVTGLMVMVLDISGTERTLSSSNQRTIQSFHAAGGGNEISNKVIKDTLQLNAHPATPKGYPGTIVVDPSTAGGSNATLLDFLEELKTGGGALRNDTAMGSPDLIVTALNNQTIQVDIDYEAGGVMLPGSELEEFAIGHHKKVGGTGCASGTLYSVDTVSLGPIKTKSNVTTAYFDCP